MAKRSFGHVYNIMEIAWHCMLMLNEYHHTGTHQIWYNNKMNGTPVTLLSHMMCPSMTLLGMCFCSLSALSLPIFICIFVYMQAIPILSHSFHDTSVFILKHIFLQRGLERECNFSMRYLMRSSRMYIAISQWTIYPPVATATQFQTCKLFSSHS